MLSEEQWQQLLEDYIEEAQELIQRSESALAVLKQDSNCSESVNELFRAVHTIKGNSGMLSLEHIVRFTHVFEDLLMQVRDGVIGAGSDVVNTFFRCLDYVSDLIRAVAHGESVGALDDLGEQLLVELAAHSGNGEKQQQAAHDTVKRDHWHLAIRFDREVFRSGFDPASLLRYLHKICEVVAIRAISHFPEDITEYDPEACYLGFHAELAGKINSAAIEEVFEFLDDLVSLYLLPPESSCGDFQAMIAELPEEPESIAVLLADMGVAEVADLLPAGVEPQAAATAAESTGPAAPATLETTAKPLKAENSFLRVPARKMDELINQVGELVIAVAGSRILANKRNDIELMENIDGLHHQIELIREAALQMRMVEINETFNRFHRVVRETAGTLGKDIQLEIRGGDTELDKSLVDKIHDPLVHLVRNAIDHGIENAEERRAAGKPEKGHMVLNAYHDSGMIVLEVSDDGGGIDVEKIRQKAISRELIREDDELSDAELRNLIFHAGFSTAQKISDLSGRGVGLDSVRRDIDALRGTVDIESELGQGTCFRIKLPLTLAIIDGFLVSIGDHYFVVPVEWVTECIETPESYKKPSFSNFMDLRGKPMPYVALRNVLDMSGTVPERESMIVISYAGENMGITVDELHGEIQTVIKPLGPVFEDVGPISGGTILGSGDVALIVDVPGVFSRTRLLSQLAISA